MGSNVHTLEFLFKPGALQTIFPVTIFPRGPLLA